MKKAIWNNKVIAEAENTVEVEGNEYFPADSLKEEFFTDSALRTTCAWKGEASYKSINVGGQTNNDAAWFYTEPKEDASHIKNLVAFWKGVEIVDE